MSNLLIEHACAITPNRILEDASIFIENGKIVQITQAQSLAKGNWQVLDANDAWLLPCFIDFHIHGMGGYGPEQATPQALMHFSTILAHQGVGVCCPTLYASHPAHMSQLIKQLLPAFGKEKGCQLLGFHLEGPFISPQKPGVMRSQDIVPANLQDFIQLYEAAQGRISIVTLAPELPGIDSIIDFCLKHHILVQAGHTNATYEQMQRACEKGVRRVTHWGNAMSGLHQRAPGVLGSALINPTISCEVIADGKHIHPALLTLLREVKPIEQITAVTDALLPTQQSTAPWLANGEEVVLADNVWKRRIDGVTAGSALTMLEAFKQLLQAGFDISQATKCTSTNAANLFGLPVGKIQEGAPANLILLSKNLTLHHIWLNGISIL